MPTGLGRHADRYRLSGSRNRLFSAALVRVAAVCTNAGDGTLGIQPAQVEEAEQRFGADDDGAGEAASSALSSPVW
jgi:hypothetical protein